MVWQLKFDLMHTKFSRRKGEKYRKKEKMSDFPLISVKCERFLKRWCVQVEGLSAHELRETSAETQLRQVCDSFLKLLRVGARASSESRACCHSLTVKISL